MFATPYLKSSFLDAVMQHSRVLISLVVYPHHQILAEIAVDSDPRQEILGTCISWNNQHHPVIL